MDIVDHYLKEESDHVPLLIEFLENEDGKDRGEIISNLFNFKANFVLNELLIEDDAGVFCKSEKEREILCTPREFLKRAKNSIKT